MLNTISPQFLQSLQPLQTAPTVKLPAAPRTCHHSIFVVSYNARRSLRAWYPHNGFITTRGFLVVLSRKTSKNHPPPSKKLPVQEGCGGSRRLWRLTCSGQNPKQPPPPSNMLFGERVCGGTAAACSFCNGQVTRVAAGEGHLCLAPAHSPRPSDCYFDDSAYSVVSWHAVAPAVSPKYQNRISIVDTE